MPTTPCPLRASRPRRRGESGGSSPGAAAGSLGKDLPPTRIPWGSRWAGRGEAAATVGAASFWLPRGGGCEKQGWERAAEPSLLSASPSQPASLALPEAPPPAPAAEPPAWSLPGKPKSPVVRRPAGLAASPAQPCPGCAATDP